MAETERIFIHGLLPDVNEEELRASPAFFSRPIHMPEASRKNIGPAPIGGYHSR